MTSLETVIPVDVERGVFDSAKIDLLNTAFEKAWIYVEFDPLLGVPEAWERQAELAHCLMALLKLGETNPTSLANSAIRLLHKNQDMGHAEKFSTAGHSVIACATTRS